MSWTVDGKSYHTWASYQEAVGKRARRLAEARATTLCREAEIVRERMRARERELEAARGDPDQQLRLQQEIAHDVKRLRRIRDRLVGVHREEHDRADAELASARDQTCAGPVVDAAPGVAQAAAPAPDTVLETLQARVESSLSDAEAGRQALETRLSQALADLEARAESARQERLRSAEGERARAEAQATLAEETLERHRTGLEELDLTEDAHALGAQIEQARALAASDSGAALALAVGAVAASRSLEMKVRRRRAELAAHRERVRERLGYVGQLLGQPDVERYFAPETARARAISGALEARAQGGYTSWRRLDIEADQDERRLDRLEDEVNRMVAAAPVVRDLASARTERARELVGKLAAIYGPVSGVQQRFAVASDRKSPLVVECDFGGARVDIHMGLEGEYTIDGYGHDTNATCSRRGEQVVGQLMADTLVTGQRIEAGGNRAGPTVDDGAGTGRWLGIGDRLREIERM